MSKRKAWFCQDCRIIMTYDTKQDFYKCPECGVEVWPNSQVCSKDDEISNLMLDMAHTHKPREAMPAGRPLLGAGGSKSKGRSRSTDMKKKTLAQINAGLAGRCALFESR